MSYDEILELEIKYGPAVAQQIIDEIAKVQEDAMQLLPMAA